MGLKEIVIGTIQWILLFIVLSVPLTIFFIWKILVIVVAKCLKRNLVILKPLDTVNAPGRGDVQSVVNFGLVCRIDGEISLIDFQKKFSQKFLTHETENSHKHKFQYERLHYALVTFLGFAFFQRIDQININELIYVRNLNEQSGQVLEELISDWILEKYKENSPCWEIIIIPMKNTNQTAIAIKLHHTLADGYSLVYILDKLTENTSPYLVKGDNDGWGQRILQMLQVPWHLGKFDFADPKTNPFACRKESPYRWSMSFTQLDLATLKQIRRKHNVHFVSIILSILGGALKRYLLDSKSSVDLPTHLHMGTTLPWPKHPSKSAQTSSSQKLCNHWITALVKVPIGDESLLQRLLEVEKSLMEFQDEGLHKFMKWVMVPLMWISPICALKPISYKDAGFSAGYSTSIGGDYYHLLGNPIKNIYPIIAMHDVNPFIPISIFSFTHSNRYDVTLSVNPQHFPDRPSLERVGNIYLPDELSKLKEM